MSRDGDGRDVIGNIVITALRKDTSAGTVSVFGRSLAVSEIVSVLPCIITTVDKCTGSTVGGGDFPSGHNILTIVAAIFQGPCVAFRITEHGIVIWKLNLAVTEIFTQGIHISDGKTDRCCGSYSIGRMSAGIYGDTYRSKFPAFPLIGSSSP